MWYEISTKFTFKNTNQESTISGCYRKGLKAVAVQIQDNINWLNAKGHTHISTTIAPCGKKKPF
jgi:hypothetical protein